MATVFERVTTLQKPLDRHYADIAFDMLSDVMREHPQYHGDRWVLHTEEFADGKVRVRIAVEDNFSISPGGVLFWILLLLICVGIYYW